MEAHHTANSWTYLEIKRSKVKVTRMINAVTGNALANPPREAKRDGCCIERPAWQLLYLAPLFGQVGVL